MSTFPSEDASQLNELFDKVGEHNNKLEMTLITTRDKLKPFVDEGVVHKDRRKEAKKNVDHSKKPKNFG